VGAIVLVVGIAACVAALPFLNRFEAWPLLPGAAAVAVGVVAMVTAANLSRLSSGGWERASRWRAFAAYLKRAARHREALPSGATFDGWLPYAAAFGLATSWAKLFRSQSGPMLVPPWFHALATSDQADALSAMIAAGHSAGEGGNAGAAGGGAAGGGSSGAG
jgi:uncharacterized membrane protein